MQLFLRGGYEVCLFDVNLEQIDSALKGISEQLNELNKEGLLFDQNPSELLKKLYGVDELEEAVKDALHVQVGNVLERLVIRVEF